MRIRQGRVELELHELAAGSGPALLLLHQLYGSSAEWGEGVAPWPGAVYALDLAGHGRSAWVKGGAYSPEILACGVDAALERIGTAALAGAGIGAYVALLVAGARRDEVGGALLLPGAGLTGIGPVPTFEADPPALVDVASARDGADPMLCVLEYDARPVDYVEPFARRARRLVFFEDGTPRPPWWEAARAAAGGEKIADVAAAVASLGR